MSQTPDNYVFQAKERLIFLQLQLVELARDCGNTVQNDEANLQSFLKLKDKLEKILHETQAACSPPKIRPVMSDFETIKRLGKGGYGTVNLVRHKDSNMELAMKIIRRDKVKKDTMPGVFLERDILTFNENPFIISAFCTFETEEHLCMVMEHAGGGDCDGLLYQYDCLPLDLVRLYAAQTVSALEYIHGYGILHGDLKPGNLLISSTGQIKLSDFGLSKVGPVNLTVKHKDRRKNAREFLDSDVFGTSYYMAPEILFAEGYGKPVDWWALGIIMYEFLMGTLPYTGKTREEVLEKVASEEIVWCKDFAALPADAKDIITRLLTRNCERRLGTGGASEVKAHPFFNGIDWNNLEQEVPPLRNEENTDQSDSDDSSSEESSSSSEDEESDEEPAELPDFCSVAFRFKEVYNCQKPLVSNVPLNEEEEVNQPEDEEVPQPESEEVPQPESEEVNQPEDEEVPQPESEEVNQPENEEVNQPENEEVPQPESEEVPQPESEEVPQPESEEVPQSESEEVPQPESEEVPQSESEEVPQPESEEVPQSESEEVPQPESEEVLTSNSRLGNRILSAVRRLFRKAHVKRTPTVIRPPVRMAPRHRICTAISGFFRKALRK